MRSVAATSGGAVFDLDFPEDRTLFMVASQGLGSGEMRVTPGSFLVSIGALKARIMRCCTLTVCAYLEAESTATEAIVTPASSRHPAAPARCRRYGGAARGRGHARAVTTGSEQSSAAPKITIHQSLILIHNSQFTIHHSQFTIQIGFPSASMKRTSPYPSSRMPLSILARSPTTTHTRLSGWTTCFAAVSRSPVVRAMILPVIVW